MVRSSPRFLGMQKKAYNRFQELSRPWTPEELARDKKRVLRNRKKKREQRKMEDKEQRKQKTTEAEKWLEKASIKFKRVACCNNNELAKSLQRISYALRIQGAKEIDQSKVLERLEEEKKWRNTKFVYHSLLQFLKSAWEYTAEYEEFCRGTTTEYVDPFGNKFCYEPQTRREFLKANNLPYNEWVVRDLNKNVLDLKPGNKECGTLHELKEKRDSHYIMCQCLISALSSLLNGQLYDIVE